MINRYCFIVASLLLSISATAQEGTKERITLYSEAIAGNLIGDSPEREVTVYLPASYAAAPERRYPVLYFLHGFTDSDSQWFGWKDHWINLKEILDATMAAGESNEMIVVMPNAYNRFKGSMYSTSATIGDWETFVSEELVNHIDAHYRTIPEQASRGLAGHSMGGYGTIRLGMKYPEVWSSIYLLSPCCMDGMLENPDPNFFASLEAVKSLEALDSLNFFQIATLASAAAWAPNPNNPPFYLDLPMSEGKLRTDVAGKFAANRILHLVDQYIYNLRQLRAIGMDAGTMDFTISGATHRLHQLLEGYGIEHQYESYDGDHLNRIAERIRMKVLPFFTENLVFE